MSRNHFNDRILKGFILSSDALFEIRQLLDRRQKTRFSEGLSPEARMALQQMREDTRVKFDEDSDDNSAGDDEEKFTGRKSVKKTMKSSRKSRRDKSRRQISFTDSPRGITSKGIKCVGQTKDVISTNESNPLTITGREGSRKQNEGDEVILTTDPNPVDKCREWVAENTVETACDEC
ncbi:hypothetical protein KP79_PYT13281 [Mizuhopecten yessoensis]|uniref:Uncharacterized protein n=1 Tax=Mizuhopecten yessoensis TaxID=6573 RepID=A0A210R3I0_MIZYE|nr:hypothetical protein KP79_PYT13281 [Mizuhopecten yessoensis]